jgi:hypothetical protein
MQGALDGTLASCPGPQFLCAVLDLHPAGATGDEAMVLLQGDIGRFKSGKAELSEGADKVTAAVVQHDVPSSCSGAPDPVAQGDPRGLCMSALRNRQPLLPFRLVWIADAT